MSEEKGTAFHRSYTVLWIVMAVTALAAEIIGLDNRFWLPWLLVFAVIESASFGLKKLRGTASSHVWWWNGGKIGRAFQCASLGVWLSWHVFLLNPSTSLGILSAGLAAWLTPHFFSRGATG